MNIQVCKTFVSSQGGSGSDMICASLNQLDIKMNPTGSVSKNAFSIKPYEPFDNIHDLQKQAQTIEFVYVTTHEFDLLIKLKAAMINIIVQDPTVAEMLILRQMTLQHLKIRVDTKSHWYMINRQLCLAGKFDKAAHHWLIQSRKVWHDSMNQRLNHHGHNLCIDTIFDPDFYKHVCDSLPAMDTHIFRSNHRHWLAKNYAEQWTEESTIKSMINKLSRMDWTQQQGIVKYQC
jgi:hypothetical protein